MKDWREQLYLGARAVLPYRLCQYLVHGYKYAQAWVKYGDPHFFKAVALEIATTCNRACAYCPVSTQPGIKEKMTMEVFLCCLQRLAEINWTGNVDYHFYNEPLLDERLPRLVQITKEYLPRSLPRIVTNGDYLTEVRVEELIGAGVVMFVVTQHNKERGPWNDKIDKLVQRWPRHFAVSYIWNIGLSRRGGLVAPPKAEDRWNCILPEEGLCLTYQGEAVMCCCDFHRLHRLGNVRDKSLKELWYGEPYRTYRDEVRRGIYRLEICRKCKGLI